MTSSKNADELIADRLDGLTKQEPLALRGLIYNLKSKPYEWYDDDIAALLEQYKTDILKYIARKYNIGQVSLPTSDIKKLLSVGIQWPELTDLVNKYKTAIIKNVLETLKLDYRSVSDTVGTLNSMNLGWKELDVINRSLTALRKDITEADWRDDYDVEEIKSNIILDLYDSDFLAVIDSIGELSHFKNLGDVARVAKQLEYHKDNLMRTMLRMAKESGTYHSLPVLNGLAKFGIKWPELDIIRKSANANNKPITEVNHELNAASYKVNIAGAVLRNDIDTLVEELAEFAWVSREHIGDVTKLTYILEQHKNRVMKGLLSYMRSLDDPGICYIMPQILGGLKNAGIKWPDLAIIDRSVEKIQKRIEDEEESNLNENDNSALIHNIITEYIDTPWLLVVHFNNYNLTVKNKLVNDAMEKAKPGLIRSLLGLMKEESHKSVPYNASLIRRVGVQWPELDTIVKSANIEIKKDEMRYGY